MLPMTHLWWSSWEGLRTRGSRVLRFEGDASVVTISAVVVRPIHFYPFFVAVIKVIHTMLKYNMSAEIITYKFISELAKKNNMGLVSFSAHYQNST